MIFPAFERAIRGVSKRARHLVGVSGGRDSVCLLRLLKEAGFRDIIVCHLNHRLRGAESNSDSLFVAELAQELEFPCVMGMADVGLLAEKSKNSIESAARIARHEFFAKVGRANKCHRIFLGHHADDRVETTLFNLFRGSGAGGGMRGVTEITMDKWKFEVIRPLLGVWREEINNLVKARGWSFREDHSNERLEFTRNRFRHTIVPQIEEAFGREIRKAVWRNAEITSEETEWMDSMVPEVSPGSLSLESLKKAPAALQRRMLLRWLRANQISDVSFGDVEAIRELVEGEKRAANLSEGHVARVKKGELTVDKPKGQ